jgi:hypothetical protein
MNEPKLPTTHPLVNAVAKQLLDAMRLDTNVHHTPLGANAMKVLAEIVSAAAPMMLRLSPEADAILTEALSLRPGGMVYVDNEIPELKEEIARLRSIISHPESDDFLKGVSIEAEYQRERHGVDDTAARFDWHQWYWVSGYLLGKALAASQSVSGIEKAKHHLITTAALLMNWHNVLTGKPAASVHSNAGKPVADMLVIIPGNGKN